MNISVERLPECKAKLSVEVSPDEVNKARKDIVSAYARQAKVPGFRPGKIPSAVVEKKFSKEVDSELRDRLARQSYAEAKEKENVEILGITQVERELFDADGSYLLTVEIVTEPEVELKEYKGIPVEVTKMEVTDEMVDRFIEDSRKRNANLSDVNRASGPGDLVVVSYTATMDGQSLNEKLGEDAQTSPVSSGDDQWLEIPQEGEEERSMIPGFPSAVSGMAPGETKTVQITFPEDYPLEELTNQSADYEVTVMTVKERELPELTDDYAMAMGVPSMDALRESVRKQFEVQQANFRNQFIDNQILAFLNEEMIFDLPQHIVYNETQRQVNQMVMRSYEQGMQEEEIQAQQDDLVKNAETQAMNNVRTMFILDEIAQRENVSVSEAEVSNAIVSMAQRQNRPVKKLAREIRDNNGFGEIRQEIKISKTIAFLRENAEIKEVEPPENAEGE